MNKIKVGIVGATGYGGVELIRLLANHPHFHVYALYSSSQHGVEISEVYPHLANSVYTLQQINPGKMAKEIDLVFTATPSGVSSQLVPQLLEEGMKVIDLSGDFRLKTEELYEKWYKKPSARIEDLQKSVYGLPEWFTEEVKESTFIANPGCYPTATLLGLAPIVQRKIVQSNSIIIDAKSGISGAGRGLSQLVHYAEINENMKIYKVNQHQHIPEIESVLAKWDEQVGCVTFSTHLVPMNRGIMSTMYLQLTEELSTEELYELYVQAYEHAPFVRIRKMGEFPSTKEVSGSNYCDIGIALDERTKRVTIVAVIDNLVKGAAGQAIQNANIIMGFEQQTGIGRLPVYP
ncbi:N-acetyl-gamma-glutamyl-phosphate reductase [Priestia megaterium]|nr:N-acetyl-gamma-glutamyl-phosphate reductase [Priestia megaterium]